MMKKCSRCLNFKTFLDFYKNCRSKDGYTPACKSCVKQSARQYKREKIIKDCLHCKKPFAVRKDKVSCGRGKYCSRQCSGKGSIPNRYGENNSNWKGGVAKDNMRYKRRFCERYPEKVKAHQIYKAAIRANRLVRQPCEVCGSTTKIHGHHDDYSKPLDVRWLCQSHHIEWHFKNGDYQRNKA